MNTKKIEVLESLIKRIKQLRKFEESIHNVFGAYPDGEGYSAVEELFNGYTELVADTLGTSSDTLVWFIHDNDCGAEGLKAGVDRNMREINTIEDFLWFIELSGYTTE